MADTVNSIDWEDIKTVDVDLLRLPVVNLKKITFFTPGYGQLIAPPGWRKISNAAIAACYLKYEIESLPETRPPQLTGDESTVVRDAILNKYYWQSSQFRIELFTSSDNGRSWIRRSTLPVMRPTGFPEGTINLLSSLNGVPLTFNSTDRLAIAFRDVGFGLPNPATDTFTVTTSAAIPQKIYEYKPLPTSTVVLNQQIGTYIPVGNGAYQQIAAANANRKEATIAFSNGAVGSTGTIRYGDVSDTAAPTQVVQRNSVTVVPVGYTGIISFSSTAGISTRVVVTETF